MTVPTYTFDEIRAIEAFNVHCALLRAERNEPALKNNPQWTIIRQDAYEAFSRAFTVQP